MYDDDNIVLYTIADINCGVWVSSLCQTENGEVQRDFRKMQSLAQVTKVLLYFTSSRLDILVSSSSLYVDDPLVVYIATSIKVYDLE